MKKLLTVALMAIALTANAQETQKKWYDNFKFSGYGMLQYQAEDNQDENKKDAEHNEFNLRLARFIIDGKINDFDYRAQIQGTSNAGPGNPTVMLVDLYAEWTKYKAFRVRAGQFKRAFTFESVTHPITQGWYTYGLVINNLVGYGDRTGEKSSGGRDLGVQVQGDLFPNANGHRLLHYQVGVYNGEGTNLKDKDNKKDIIGGLWVSPVKGVRLGAFGWTGTRGEMTWTETGANGIATTCKGSIRKNRYALSAEYDKNEFTFRCEYIHSQGWGVSRADEGKDKRAVDFSRGDKADGFYAFGIVPVIKSKLHAKARYNMYRPEKQWSTSKTMYEVGANYFFNKNLQLNLEYARVNDRSIANPDKHNYNFVDVELDFRF